jgi:hypothetical protein
MRETLQRALSCVTAGVLVVHGDAIEVRLSLTSRLARSRGDEPIVLQLRHAFMLVNEATQQPGHRWRARLTGYQYSLEGADVREIVAYHWHPAGRSRVVLPHLHLGAGAGALRPELVKGHLPSGLVTPIAVLRLALEQFAVRARRADWSDVLQQTERSLETAFR